MTFDILSRRAPVSEIIDRIYRVVLVCCAPLTCGGCTVQSDGAHSTRDSKTTLERERDLSESGNHILLRIRSTSTPYRFSDLKRKTSYPSHRFSVASVAETQMHTKIRACNEVAPSGTQKKSLLQEEGISLNTNAAISRAMRAVSHRTPLSPRLRHPGERKWNP